MLYNIIEIMQIAKIYISGIIGEDTTLLDVMRQYKGFANPTAVEVFIDSIGGSVDEGQSIYSYLRALGVPVKTVAQKAYSIAATIFMAGDTRTVEKGEDRLMIHMPFVMNATGGSSELDSISKELKSIETEFVNFYANYTNIDQDSIRRLLENETFLSGDEAFSLGFATSLEIPLKAVAFLESDENNKPKNDKNYIMKLTKKLISAMQSFVSTNEETPEMVALVLQDANGAEITFPDVANDAEPALGDKAMVDGKPAEGEIVLPDGSTWKFEGGSLSEVVPAEAPAEEEVPAEEEANADETPAEETPEVAAEEEGEVEEEMTSEQFELLLTELFNKAKTEVTTEMEVKFTALQKVNDDLNAEIVAVKKLMGSEDLNLDQNEKINTPKMTKAERAASILNKRK